MHTECAKKNTHHFFASRHFTQNSFYTAETLPHRSLYGQIFFKCTAIFPEMVLTQKVLRTEGFMHNIFYIQTLYTQMPLHGRRIAHRNLCTQHTFTRNQLLHREFCFPFFITYLSRSPSQAVFLQCGTSIVRRNMGGFEHSSRMPKV